MKFSERLQRAQEAWGAWLDIQPHADQLRLELRARDAFHAGFMMGVTARENRRRRFWGRTR